MLSKATNLSPSSTTTSVRHELLINDDYSMAMSSTASLNMKTVLNLANPAVTELVSEPAQFVIVRDALSPQYETLKVLTPLSHASANETMLPACGTLLLNHSSELITKTSPSYVNDGM